MKDDFKYKDFDKFPTSYGKLETCAKEEKYAFYFDIAEDIPKSFFLFAEGYFKSAHIIAERIFSECLIDELDRYCFPLIFLYRHSIELMLKSIAFIEITDSKGRIDFMKDTFHNLKQIFEQLLSRASIKRPKEEESWIIAYFSNLSMFDKDSDSFRYPFHISIEKDTISGQKKYTINRIFDKQTHINLLEEANKFEAAYEIIKNWYLDYFEPEKAHESLEYIACDISFMSESGSYYEQAVVGYEYQHDDFYAHCTGYFECAKLLKQAFLEIENINSSDLSKEKYLIYPILYLYRNTVELLLKGTIFQYSDLEFQSKCIEMKKTSINCIAY